MKAKDMNFTKAQSLVQAYFFTNAQSTLIV